MTHPRPSTRLWQPLRRVVPLALTVLGLGLLAILFWPAPAPNARPAAPPVAAALPTPAPATRETLPVVDAGQWAQLQAALADHPQRDAELARILGVLDYQRAVQRFAALRQAEGATPARQALARRLDAELPQRLARGELSGPEAVRLKAALLEVLQPDPALRASALADWRDARQREHPPAVDPRDTAFLQAQAGLVARWRATSPPGTPPDDLLKQLEALRQQTYDRP